MTILRSITVFGSAQPQPDSPAYKQACELGRRLASAGFAVINGGYTGTMSAVSQGAVEAGGTATGITCALFDSSRPQGNPYLSAAIHTPDLLSRLRQLVERGDGYVVLGGGVGTLLELFLVWNMLAIGVFSRPCVLVGAHWRRVLFDLVAETQVGPEHTAMLHIADTVKDAVRWLSDTLANAPDV
jgi:uncharacterized protein (TIGR00730 family)